MKGTDHFKKTIEEYLIAQTKYDESFAKLFVNESKNIDDCITYILNTVQQSGCNGFEDREIFGMAMHYYQEETIDVGKPTRSNVIVNHAIELTPEEIKKAKEKALAERIKEEKEKLNKKSTPKVIPINSNTPTLF